MPRTFSPAAIAILLCALSAGCRGEPDATFSGIEIYGDNNFIAQVEQALALIENNSPDEFDAIAKYVKRIESHQRSGMDMSQDVPTCQLAAATAFHSLTWCAGCIAHEAHHSKLHQEPGHEYGMAEEEQACNAVQLKVLQSIGAPQGELDHLAAQDGKHFDMDGDGAYTWEDYEQRNW